MPTRRAGRSYTVDPTVKNPALQPECSTTVARSLWGGLSALLMLALAVSLGVSADQLLASTIGSPGADRVEARAEQSRVTVVNRRSQERPDLAARVIPGRALSTSRTGTVAIADRDEVVGCLVHVTKRATPPPAA